MSEEKEIIKIEYNRNPFIPKGRLNRKYYFIYMMLFDIMTRIAGYDLSKGDSLSAIIIAFMTTILTLFVVRNRLYDITLSNRKAWLLGILFCLISIVLSSINPQFMWLLLPFGLLILCINSKGVNSER